MVKSEKQFDTGLRILEILKILLDDNLSKNSLITRLSTNSDIEQVYTLEAFIKYFNTIEIMGLRINREKNIYKLENALTYLELTKKEKDLFIKLISNLKLLYNEKQENAVKTATYRTLKFFDNEIPQTLTDKVFETENMFSCSDEQKNLIETINKFINEKLMVQIEYKRKTGNVDLIIAEIRKIQEIDGKIMLTCYLPEKYKNKKINLSTVISLSQLQNKITGSKVLNTIVFEVYGRLAYLYRLKPSEKVINFSNSHLVISNSEEDKDVLLKRLLKYGENCKIIKPIEVKEEFLSLTNDILKNLGAINDRNSFYPY